MKDTTGLTLDLNRFALLSEDAPAYGGDPERKAAAVQIAQEHERLDRIVQGRYWTREDGENAPRGCLIGCMTHSGDHEQMQALYGVPYTIARLCDYIFENLPADEAPMFVPAVMEAIPTGADLSGVMDRFRAWMLRDLLNIPDLAADVRAAVEGMAVLFERRVAGDEPTETEWQAAADAAWDAWDAGDARDAWAARAAYDARAARAAWDAGDARAAETCAWGKCARDVLLGILREAAVTA